MNILSVKNNDQEISMNKDSSGQVALQFSKSYSQDKQGDSKEGQVSKIKGKSQRREYIKSFEDSSKNANNDNNLIIDDKMDKAKSVESGKDMGNQVKKRFEYYQNFEESKKLSKNVKYQIIIRIFTSLTFLVFLIAQTAIFTS